MIRDKRDVICNEGDLSIVASFDKHEVDKENVTSNNEKVGTSLRD